MTARYRLAASAEMLFQELEFNERVKHIAARGFEVEIWNWTTKNLSELAATGATFSSMTGYIEGDLLESGGIENLLSTARQSLEASLIINCPRLKRPSNQTKAQHHPGRIFHRRLDPHPSCRTWCRIWQGLHSRKSELARRSPRHALCLGKRDARFD